MLATRSSNRPPQLGARVIAVVLTGYDSGGMPLSAIGTACVDKVLPLGAIAAELVRLAAARA